MQRNISFLALIFALSGCVEEAPPAVTKPEQVLSAPLVSQEVVQSWMKKAKFDELRGDFSAAAQSYTGAVHADPSSREARLGLASAHRHLGEYDKAFAIYTDLLKADPNSLEAKEGGALTLIAKGDFDSSIALLDEVIKADPRRPEALNGMGVLFTTRNMQPEAQQYFIEALKFSPNNATIIGNFGLSQALQGKYKEAGAALSQASAAATPGSYERKRADMSAALVHAAAGRAEDALAIAGAYYGGAEYNTALGLYAKLAKDKKMAASYIRSALTGGRTYYEQGWDTLATSATR
ncbi:MAG: tetratricopeptide repeat protein [Alphaproteobacteria bacterium]|nr:tetratricopeptide repeat protein [Alphaproteobacteria bacterium]